MARPQSIPSEGGPDTTGGRDVSHQIPNGDFPSVTCTGVWLLPGTWTPAVQHSQRETPGPVLVFENSGRPGLRTAWHSVAEPHVTAHLYQPARVPLGRGCL